MSAAPYIAAYDQQISEWVSTQVIRNKVCIVTLHKVTDVHLAYYV